MLWPARLQQAVQAIARINNISKLANFSGTSFSKLTLDQLDGTLYAEHNSMTFVAVPQISRKLGHDTIRHSITILIKHLIFCCNHYQDYLVNRAIGQHLQLLKNQVAKHNSG